MIEKRKISVVSSSRADYGLLRESLRLIEAAPNLSLSLIATGQHLEKRFGSTIQEILDDGISVAHKVFLGLKDDSPTTITQAIGSGVSQFGAYFSEAKPDILLLLGDRYEMLCPAIAAMMSNTPVAHIHGGELTQGAIDDSVRHCLTKISHLHFVATEEYRNRVIQLGEEPKNVFNVGATGVDAILNTDFLDQQELETILHLDLSKQSVLVTFNPETLNPGAAEKHVSELIHSMKNHPNVSFIITHSNADPGSNDILTKLEEFTKETPNASLHYSLGHKVYVSLMRICAAVLGNTSSGILEAPTFNIPTINIGNRQDGRIQGKTVINCPPEASAITQAIKLALSEKFVASIANEISPYGNGGASQKIVDVLSTIDLTNIRYKSFFDIK